MKDLIQFKTKLSAQERFLFINNLCKLTQAGLPLIEAITILKNTNTKQHRYYQIITQQLHLGQSFSFALKQSRIPLDSLAIELIEVGEHSGQLEKILLLLSQHYQQQASLAQQLKKALVYPACLALFSIMIIASLFWFIIPKFTIFFKGSEQHLPLVSKLVFGASNQLREHGLLIGLSIVLIVICMMLILKKNPRLRRHMPPLSMLTTLQLQQQLCTSFSIGLSAGMTALAIAQNLQSHGQNDRKKNYTQLKHALNHGHSLSSAFEQARLLPKHDRQFIHLAEKSGQLEYYFNFLSQQYIDTMNEKASTLMRWIEPLMIVALGSIIGVVILAIYLPMFKLGNLIS